MRTIRRRTFLSAWRTLVGPVGPASQLHLPPTSQVLTTQRPHVLPQLEQQRALLRRHHATKAAGGGEGGSSGGPVYGHVSEGADGDTVLYMRDAGSGREYYVIGTAHISKQSAQQVERLMHTIRPDSVMVELCAARARQLMSQEGQKQDYVKQIIAQIPRLFGGAFGGFSGSLLETGFKMFYDVFRLLGFVPGLEFKVAMTEAKKLNIPVVYGDQEASITMKRLSGVITLEKLISLCKSAAHSKEILEFQSQIQANSIEEMVEKLKNRELVRKFTTSMKQIWPEILEVMLTERDQFMASNLRRCPGHKVMAVVGLAHLDGIENSFKPIMALPPPSPKT